MDDPVLVSAERWWKKLHNPLGATFRITFAGRPKPVIPSDREIVQSVVATVASDEVSLHQGHFITEDDVAKLRAEVLAHDFQRK